MTEPARSTPTTAGTNWAGNVTFTAPRLVAPTSLEELADLVCGASSVRSVGSRHTFSALADSDDLMVSVEALGGEVTVHAERGTASVPAGMRYADVARALDAAGWALSAMASLPHITVAGAISTGTHGSGDAVGSLADAVVALDILRSDGSLVTVSRGDADFAGAVVALGVLGVVTRVELAVEPRYVMTQVVDRGLPWDAALADLDAVMGSAESVSLFTTWADPDRIDQVWRKRRGETAPEALPGAHRAGEPGHPLEGGPAENCTDQTGAPGPWFERLPHFRAEFTPSHGEELQSEFFVPRAVAAEALSAVRALGSQVQELLYVSEIRSIRADDLWLSGAYGRDTIGIHFTWRRDEPAVRALVREIEAVLAPFDARPHWGKVFTADPAVLARLYPRWADFAALREHWDPRGVFRNAQLAAWGL